MEEAHRTFCDETQLLPEMSRSPGRRRASSGLCPGSGAYSASNYRMSGIFGILLTRRQTGTETSEKTWLTPRIGNARAGQKVRDLLPTPHSGSENSDQMTWLVPHHTTHIGWVKHIWNLSNKIISWFKFNLRSWSYTPQINSPYFIPWKDAF